MSPFEQIVQQCPDAIVVCDADGVIQFWNRSAEELFGWSATEASGRKPVELFVPPDERREYVASVSEMLTADTAGSPRTMGVWNRDQKRFSVDCRFARVVHDGRELHVGYFHDVSHVVSLETLVARQDLESQILGTATLYSNDEESFEGALRQTLDTLCALTSWPIGHAFLASESDQHLISSPIWSITDGIYEDFCSSRTDSDVSRGVTLVGEVWKSGAPEWRLLTDPQQELGVAQLPGDICSQFCLPIMMRRRVVAVLEFFLTDRESPDTSLQTLVRKLSQSLGQMIERRDWEEERRRMAAIVESSYDGILSKDPSGLITSWNEGAERLYGYSAAEAVGQSVRLILPDSLESEEPEVRKTMETGERLEQFETRRLRKDGKELNVSLTVSPLRNAEGRIIGTASIERDITRRKQSQHRLQEAIVAAEKANQAKTEFLANISHELRTPMNAILGMTNLALQEELSDVVRDYLITARDSADTMLFLINDILDFSRLEAERFELDNAPFDVRHMLEETMRLLSLRAHEKGLELVTRISPDVPTRIVGDVMRVRQILTNLIGNAIKFTETGEVVASVSLAAADHAVAGETWNPGDEVSLLFCVRDTGIGISPEDQDRIFAPFAQADASTTRTYAGTGLGLSICQALVKLMDGRLWVESQLDVGSRFYFSSHFEVAATAEEDHTLSIDIDDLRDTQVLIVDDNESNLQTLKTMLEAWEMRPVLANNAEAAIELLEAATREGNGFSLLLVDAVMPHRDGVELLEAIEESTATAGATVLMLSPADQPVFRYRTEKLHVGAVLDKPVSQSGLLNAIAQAFGDVAFVQSPHAPINAIAHPLRVLVAEDIAANQKVIETILARRGHVVTVAHNGRDAITLHQQQTFDAVLMDIQMPIMDGLQAVRAIRERESEGEHIPVIAMTAHAMRGDREACLQAGMDAYVSKPIDAASLLTTLEEIAGRSPGVHTGERTSAQREPDAETGLQRAEDDVEATDSAVWNPAVALKRLGDDKSLLVNLIDFFFEDSTRLQEQLPDAISAGDAREVTRLAHSLKGLCSNFEAAAATAAASEIEEAGRAGQLGLAAAGLADLDLRLDQLRGELALWQSGPTP